MPDSTLVNIGKIGDILKDAADALKKFADSIAHIAKLGDEAWSTVAARRAQSRLMEIYKRTQAYGIGQMIVLSMMHTDVVLDLDIDLITREREWSMLLRSWPMELDHISSLIPDVKALLAELDRERSDFVLQEAYGSLRDT